MSDEHPLARRFIAAARQRWPQLPDRSDELAAALCAREDSLESLRGGDLYLAFLCARGEPAALAVFEQTLTPQMDSVLAQVRAPEAARDEIKQVLRERLLVGKQGRPVIADYQGRSSLRLWVRVSVLRELYRLTEREKRWRPLEDEQLSQLSAQSDPELAYLKERYRDAFNGSFASAMEALTPRQRNLLKHYYLDGMTVEQIGAVYGFHKATATRQLGRIRQQLLEDTREAMMARLEVNGADCDSILRLVKSQLVLSIGTYLDPPED